MNDAFAEGTLTHGRVWELKASAVYRTFNAMLANEVYVNNRTIKELFPILSLL